MWLIGGAHEGRARAAKAMSGHSYRHFTCEQVIGGIAGTHVALTLEKAQSLCVRSPAREAHRYGQSARPTCIHVIGWRFSTLIHVADRRA